MPAVCPLNHRMRKRGVAREKANRWEGRRWRVHQVEVRQFRGSAGGWRWRWGVRVARAVYARTTAPQCCPKVGAPNVAGCVQQRVVRGTCANSSSASPFVVFTSNRLSHHPVTCWLKEGGRQPSSVKNMVAREQRERGSDYRQRVLTSAGGRVV